MTLLDSFLLQFGTEGLDKVATEMRQTEKQIEALEKKEKELKDAIKEGGEEAKKAEEELKKVSEQLKQQEKHLKKLSNSWDGMLVNLRKHQAEIIKIAGTFGGLFVAFRKVSDFAAKADTFGQLAQNAGVATDTLQDLTNAVEHWGGSAEGAAASVSMLSDSLTDISKGGDGGGLKDITAKMGISTNVGSVDEFFENVAAKMDTLKTQAEKVQLGHELGLDDGTIQMLSQGLDGYKKQLENISKYRVFTKDDISNSRQFEMTMRDIRMGTAAIGANLAQLLLPVISKLAVGVKNVIDFFVKHSPFIKALLTLIGITFLPLIITNVAKLGWELLKWVMFNPILAAIAVAIMLIAALIDDLYTWLQGGDSLFGKFWEALFGPADKAREFFASLVDDIKKSFEVGFMVGIVSIVQNAAKIIEHVFKNLFKKLPQPIQDFVSKVKAIFDNLPAPLKALLKFVEVTNPLGLVMHGAKIISDVANKKKNGSHASGLDYVPYDGYLAELHKGERVQTADEAADWRRNLAKAKAAISMTSSFNLNSIPSGITNAFSNSSSNRTISIGNITIQTQATDAGGIANDLGQAIKQAFVNLNNGIIA